MSRGRRVDLTDYQRAERERQSRWRGSRRAGRVRVDEEWYRVGWVLEPASAMDSLHPSVADAAVGRFAAEDISWHEEGSDRYGHGTGPTPNLMSSQVACLNAWLGLEAGGEEPLLAGLRVLVPEADAVLAPLEPEWIGLRNYLGEREPRRRGQYATGADLLVVYGVGGERRGLLLESKYSEAYGPESLRFSKSGTDRAATYQPHIDVGSTFKRGARAADLMFDPFDQLLRLQLLAAAMEDAGELDLARVSVGWVAPRSNRPLWEWVHPPKLAGHRTVDEAWASMLVEPDRFRAAAYEAVVAAAAPHAPEWARWMGQRYGWSP